MEINGRAIAKEILGELAIKVQKLKEKGVVPALAIILVGEDTQSISYIEQKEIKAAKIGIEVKVFKLNSNISENELIEQVNKLNEDPSIHGIIIQRPTPNIASEKLNEAVIPKKDVDGFNPKSLFEPPIAEAVIKLLKPVEPDFANKKIAVIGKGETGGGPVIRTLQKMGADLSIIDSKTNEPGLITQNADIIISTVGKPNVVRSDSIKKGSILVSVGLYKGEDGKMHGDYDENDIKNVASFYTPTPGGVGPVNVACLLSNLVKSAEYGNR